MKIYLILLLALSNTLFAGDNRYFRFATYSNPERAVKLVVPADYLTISFTVSSSIRDNDDRAAALKQVDASIEHAANSNPNIFVKEGPTTYKPTSNKFSKLSTSLSYPDTNSFSNNYLCIPFSDTHTSIYSCINEINKFISEINLPRYTKISLGTTKLAMKNPEDFRGQYLKLLKENINHIRENLGNDYKVSISGLEQPIHVSPANKREVLLSLPYSLTINQKD